MQKITLMIGLLSLSITSFSQAPSLWWKLDGTNVASGSSAVGTSNNESLRFVTYGSERMRIAPNGEYFLNSLTGISNGLLGIKDDGLIYRIDYSGNNNDVLHGDGTFGPVSITTGWNILNSVLYADHTKNVAIGTNLAPEKLTVNGNILASGSISGTSLNVIDIVTSGKEFKISTSLCMKGIDANTPGTRNELCGMNGDLFIQSEANNTYNTVLNYGNNTKVGIGIIPTEDFHVGVKAKFDQDIFTNRIVTNRITSEDSLIYFGDSTIVYNWPAQNIYGETTQVNVKGLGLGVSAIGIGKWSTAIGYKVRTNAEGAIVMGSSNLNGSTFWNTTPYSLAVGFKSNIPTFFVGSANGTGTFGNVGIGTSAPQDRFQIGNDYTSVSFGRADVGDLQFGTSYMGFNATRTSAGWIVKTDGAGNGAGVIYSTLHGKMFFSSIPNTGAINKTLTDEEIVDNAKLVIHPNGDVTIGTDCPAPGYKLSVDGRMITEELNIQVNGADGCWPDYVFEVNYKLPTLKEVENYTINNKHLPGIPSAKEIENNGMNVAEMNMNLLKKTEELTLYLIEMDKKLEELKKENSELNKKIIEIENRK